MAYKFTYVHTSVDKKVITSRNRIVVLQAIPVGGGGGGLLEIPTYVKIPFEIEMDVDGIKAFKIKRLYSVFGEIRKLVVALINILGIVSKSKIKELSLNGVSSKVLDEVLPLRGTKTNIVSSFNHVYGKVEFKVVTEQFLKGIINQELKISNHLIGTKKFTDKRELNTIGAKLNPIRLDYDITGKRDRRKIILSILNIE